MSMRIADLVSEWESVPFDGGYEGLRTLASREFSGAVVSGPAQLFMLNGRVVGIVDGDLETFENGGGTARKAPHDALPLLVVMQDKAEEPRAQYYTEDTPIADVDRTLTDGKFTGYVELSENVLSGDYYLVYHQGRSMSVAWVGSSQRLITDDEAFEQADGEVGIYEVMPADIEPIELPDPEPDTTVGGVGAGSTESSDAGVDTPTTDISTTETSTTDTSTIDTGTETPDTSGTATESDDEFAEPALETDTSADESSSERVASSSHEERTDRGAERSDRDSETSDRGTERSDRGAERSDRGSETSDRGPPSSSGPPGSKAAGGSQGRTVDSGVESDGPDSERQREETVAERAVETTDVETAEDDSDTRTTDRTSEEPTASSEPVASDTEPATRDPTPRETEPTTTDAAATTPPETENVNTTARSEQSESPPEPTQSDTVSGATSAAALETRSIPSLDPGRSSSDTASTPTERQSPTSEPVTSEPTTEPEPATDDQPATTEPAQQGRQPTSEPDDGPDEAAELAAELDEREHEIQQLESEIRDLSAENEELAAERDRLRAELEEARAEIQRLEQQLDSAEMPATGSVQLTAVEAIDGTNLFVRYHSKGEATLAKAKEGSMDRSAVEENLRLEYHTQFDAADAVVDGVEFETFLQESIHYRFVNWLVRNLLYEIRDTGHGNEMSVLYEALPEVDRAELNGNVSVVYTEDGKEHREQQQFDVVVRDRMGNPLIVANINDAREAATNEQMTDIVRNAERVGNSSGSLAAAFLVTSSFFEPEALETAEEATSSGLFSRDKRKSFVNLSRKDGYHLCLLEARNNEFHLAVPEL